jgi:hypothetical protein
MRIRDYDKIKAMSCSKLKIFKKSPEHWKYFIANPEPPTADMIFGTALHSYVLEGEEAFKRDIFVLDETKRPVPDKNYQTHANRDWKAGVIAMAALEGKELITMEEFEKIKIMNDKLRKNPRSKELIEFTRNQFESVARWKWNKSDCKSLLDIRNEIFLCDLKKSRDADPINFHRQFFSLEYDLQSGMYSDADCGGNFSYHKAKDFFYIAVEDEPPYGISVHKVSTEVIQKGVEEYRDLVDKLQICIDNDLFESYEFKNLDGIFEIKLPFWKKED